MGRVIKAACCAALVLVPGALAGQPNQQRPLYLSTTPIALLVDATSGATLFARNADARFAPASVTKVMTAYVVLNQIKAGRITPDSRFTVTPAIWEQWRVPQGGSSMFLSSGESVRVDDLMTGLITVSGNDAAVTLAHGIDGSEGAFVSRMNRTARHIGMKRSNFGTSNGWPDGGMTRVTARDLVMLARRLIADHPDAYARYFSQPGMRWGRNSAGQPYAQDNRNPLLGRVRGADGLKTGRTNEAGYTFLGSAQRRGRRLFVVVGRGASKAQRQDEATRLIEWGFANWRIQPLLAFTALVGTARVQGGTQAQVGLRPARPVVVALPRGHTGALRAAIRYTGPLVAPVRQGDAVAELVVTPDQMPPQHFALVAAEAVPTGGLFDRLAAGWQRLVGR